MVNLSKVYQMSGDGQAGAEEGQVEDVDEDDANAGVQAEKLKRKIRILMTKKLKRKNIFFGPFFMEKS